MLGLITYFLIMIFMLLILIIVIFPQLSALLRFLKFLFTGKDPGGDLLAPMMDFVLIVAYPLVAFAVNVEGDQIDCCTMEGAATFAEDHLLSVFVLYFLAVIAYYFSKSREHSLPPIPEAMTNIGMLAGTILCGVIFYQYFGGSELKPLLGILGCLPVMMLFIMELYRSHQRFMAERFPPRKEIMIGDLERSDQRLAYEHGWEDLMYQLMARPLLIKTPILTVLALPVVICMQTVLLLFGQRPDSLILAFTQTYYQGFSDLGDWCVNNPCTSSGHYLCSVAAGGHRGVVKPFRMGIRHGHTIVCNRQLLVANAFEELIQDRFPTAHRFIRRNYDRVGDFIHKDYSPYENKYLCDLIYLLMKPADWCFRIVLYTFDRRPEDRIARQYTIFSKQ